MSKRLEKLTMRFFPTIHIVMDIGVNMLTMKRERAAKRSAWRFVPLPYYSNLTYKILMHVRKFHVFQSNIINAYNVTDFLQSFIINLYQISTLISLKWMCDCLCLQLTDCRSLKKATASYLVLIIK